MPTIVPLDRLLDALRNGTHFFSGSFLEAWPQMSSFHLPWDGRMAAWKRRPFTNLR